MTLLALYDYGAGNIFSLKNSFERLGARVDVVTSFERPYAYDGLLLPGVGNFDPAMRGMPEYGVREFAGDSMPVLGICLGMEMFLDSSEEGVRRGLGVIPGKVEALPSDLKVPHMGWNRITINGNGTLLDGLPDGSWMYFVHSYTARPEDPATITAISDYGIEIAAVIEHRNYAGTQFHPEKSGSQGRAILENFLGACRR